MEFTLYYRGPLKANRGAKEKHELRRHFHNQLKEFWNQKPLIGFQEKLLDKTHKDQSINIIKEIGSFRFAPLVAEKVSLVAELDISLLRPEPPGSIIIQSGDIDNRLKTLLDALKVPSSPGALPSDAIPSLDENPFFCLLEDDSLITRISVTTDRLLEPGIDPSEAIMQIHVTTKQIEVYFGTVGLA